jgi:NAD(P) transhydrogenase
VDTYDLVVIGSGPAGEKGAAQAAYFGKRVALVERAPHVGGAGINTGTVPSKTLRETALYFSGLKQRGLYGVDYSLKTELTVRNFMYREHEVVRDLRAVVERNLERHGIELVRGTAVFEDLHTVRVLGPVGGARRVRGDVILIATGSVPSHPRNVPFDDPGVWDSDEILEMRELPRWMAVVGAGVIGCEYASTFAALGISVVLIDGRDRLLSFLDGEIAERLRLGLERLGVQVRLRDAVAAITPEPAGIRLVLKSGEPLGVDAVLFAAGRHGNTAGLELERVGIQPNERGLLAVNEHYQTAVPHVYAAGDVIGFPALAATSMEQARVAMVHAFDLKYKERVAPIFPLTIYTIPEVAMVGETEESCREKGIDCCVGRSFYRHNARGQIIGDLDGELKLVCGYPDGKLLGVHIVGEDAAELVHVGMMVIQAGGGVDAFIQAVFNYPSLGEAYKYAAYDALGAIQRRGGRPSPVPELT